MVGIEGRREEDASLKKKKQKQMKRKRMKKHPRCSNGGWSDKYSIFFLLSRDKRREKLYVWFKKGLGV